MKVNELLAEALPGVKKPGFFRSLFGKGPKPDPEVQQTIDTGVQNWLAYVQKLQTAGTFSDKTTPEEYTEVFKGWASQAIKLPKNSPKIESISQTMLTDLSKDPDKAVENAIKGLVTLSINRSSNTNDKPNYTPEQKQQAVMMNIDKKYGKYIKDLNTKVELEKFVKAQVKANPQIEPQQLQDDTVEHLKQLLTPPAAAAKSEEPTQEPITMPGGEKIMPNDPRYAQIMKTKPKATPEKPRFRVPAGSAPIGGKK